MSSRPRVQFLVDHPRRAHARVARSVARHLAEEFEIRVFAVSESPDLAAWPCDLLHVSAWDATWYRQFDLGTARIVKSVRDLRWADADRGAVAPDRFAATWLADADLVSCCSERLRELLAPHCRVALTPLGFDPFVFPVRDPWRGPIQFGSAGDAADPASGFRRVLAPAAGGYFPLRAPCGDLQQAEVGEFFRSIDVFALAEPLEDTPLTLVEALASGCFPVCAASGLVPELVHHGENGLVVEPTVSAFRAAFAWCAANPDLVRHVGRRSGELLRLHRTWHHVAEHWRAALWAALGEPVTPTFAAVAPGLDLHRGAVAPV